MPVDYQQIHSRIKAIGASAQERRRTLDEQRALARRLFKQFADQPDVLRAKVDAAKKVDPNLRCALPLDEPLDSRHPAPAAPHRLDAVDGGTTGDPVSGVTLIAADGSQINPDRHAAVQFGVVNVGAIVLRLDSGTSTEVTTQTELLYGDELETDAGLLSDGMVALRRDLNERVALEDLSKGFPEPVVTFTDGPIELWGAQGEDPQAFAAFVEKYKGVLSRLQARGVITAGYVDKPSADLVLRLLEIGSAPPEQMQNLRTYHPLRRASDRWLFSEAELESAAKGEKTSPLLPSGHRSAVFGIQSGSEKKYTGSLALCFFYLNVGTEGHPWPVRVEIPKWVADDKQKLGLLHAVLVAQCRVMGSKPYPYLLHRAHETAVVSQDEKFQIEQMLVQEMRHNEEEIDLASPKSSAKALKGRTRSA